MLIVAFLFSAWVVATLAAADPVRFISEIAAPAFAGTLAGLVIGGVFIMAVLFWGHGLTARDGIAIICRRSTQSAMMH